MVHSEHPFLESPLMKSLIAPGSAFALTFIFLVLQYTFKLDFQCPCNSFSNDAFCCLYICLPTIGLFFILMFVSKTCATTRARCRHCSNTSCWKTACKNIWGNFVLSILWIITILIDGDALVCIALTDKNITKWYDQIPCKEKDKLTANESNDIRHYQALSQVIGLTLLFLPPLIWTIVSMVQCCKPKPLYKSLFEDVFVEETMCSAEMEMREMIKIYAKEKCTKIFREDMDLENFSDKLVDLITEEDPVLTISNYFSPTSASSSSQPKQDPP